MRIWPGRGHPLPGDGIAQDAKAETGHRLEIAGTALVMLGFLELVPLAVIHADDASLEAAPDFQESDSGFQHC